MTNEQQEKFERLVQQLEKYSRHHPGYYRLRVGLLAVLGYGYLIFVFLLLLSIIWLFKSVLVAHTSQQLVGDLNWIAILLSLSLLRLFWVKIKIPKGLTLDRQQAPELFATIDTLTAILQAPKCHHILLTDELNAGILQKSRFCFLPWQQNYLLLGLPLMQALSPGQFRAVLAHELGHLSGNHSRFSNWIYGLRKIWFELAEQFHDRQQNSFFLFRYFFDWYAPYFQAYSFVLARANEYEADRCGVELAGLQNEANADLNLAIYGHFLHRSFLPNLYQQAEYRAEPPNNVITLLLQQLKIGLSPREACKWLTRALTQKTDYEDTHPCLLDRLAAIGYDLNQIQPPQPEEKTAAEHFFGESLWNFAASLDRLWQKDVAQTWHKQYIRLQQQRQNLAALNTKAQRQTLTVEEMWKRACLTWSLHDPQQAIALFQKVLELAPNHPLTNYQLGKVLIENNDFGGIQYLEKVLENEPELIISSCDLLSDFYQQEGKLEKANFYQQRSQEYAWLWRRSYQERTHITHQSSFEPHQLPEAEIRQLSEQLSSYGELKKVYLVRQKITYFPDKAFYIFGIVTRFIKGVGRKHKSHQELIEQIETELNFSGNFKVIILPTNPSKLGRSLQKNSGSCIYYA
jgi:Zn-dependent protease with chaperone function